MHNRFVRCIQKHLCNFFMWKQNAILTETTPMLECIGILYTYLYHCQDLILLRILFLKINYFVIKTTFSIFFPNRFSLLTSHSFSLKCPTRIFSVRAPLLQQLSQFWYDDATATTLAKEIINNDQNKRYALSLLLSLLIS